MRAITFTISDWESLNLEKHKKEELKVKTCCSCFLLDAFHGTLGTHNYVLKATLLNAESMRVVLTRHDPLAHQFFPRPALLELQLQHCRAAKTERRWRFSRAFHHKRHIFKYKESLRTEGCSERIPLNCNCNCRSGLIQQGFRILLWAARGSCEGSCRAITIHKVPNSCLLLKTSYNTVSSS